MENETKTKQIEVVQLQKAATAIPAGEIGALQTAAPAEVSGRMQYAQCLICGFVGAYTHDDRVRAYRCGHCNAILVLEP